MQTRLFQLRNGDFRPSPSPLAEADLRSTQLFANLDAGALRSFRERSLQQTLRRRSPIFAQGDAASRLYLVISGHVRLSRCSSEGRELTLAMAGPGETIGEEAFFARASYAGSATCCTASQVLSVARDEVLIAVAAHPGLAVNVARILQQRLERTSAMLEFVAYDRVGTRLFHFLRGRAAQFGSGDDEGTTFRLDFTHSDIASLIASTRETVTAEFANLVRAGRIRFRGRHIVTLLDLWFAPDGELAGHRAIV